MKGKPYVLQYCWNLLEKSDKWRLRGQEAPPNKGALVNLEDDYDSDDAPKGGRNKGKPDERKMDKDRVKWLAKASNLREKVSKVVKVK